MMRGPSINHREASPFSLLLTGPSSHFLGRWCPQVEEKKMVSAVFLTCLLPHSRFLPTARHTHTLAHTRDLCVSIPSISFHLTCPPPPPPSPRPATKAQTISFCLFIYSLRFFDDQVECKHVRDPGEKCLFSPSKGPWDTRLMSSAEPGRGRCNRYSWLPFRINQLLNAVGWAKGRRSRGESTWMPAERLYQVVV
jgi:hypothetical protein